MHRDITTSLRGKTIIVTRSADQQSQARKLFEAKGANILELPALIIYPPDDSGPLDEALKELEDFHWIIFSSSNGVKAVQERLLFLGSSLSRKPSSLKIAAVGLKTANYLEHLGIIPDFVPPDFLAESLIKNFPVSGFGLRMLLPRVQTGGRNVLKEAFLKSGARVVEVPAYETKCPEDIPEKTIIALKNKSADAIVFTSSKTVSHTALLLNKFLGSKWLTQINELKIISIGPQTSVSCKKYFMRLDQEADIHDLDGLVEACVKSIT